MVKYLDILKVNSAVVAMLVTEHDLNYAGAYQDTYADLEEKYKDIVDYFKAGGVPELKKALIDTKMRIAMEATAKGVPYK